MARSSSTARGRGDRRSTTTRTRSSPRDGTIVVAAAVGFGQSDDGGRTFSWTTDGLHATYCRAVAIADDVVLVTASTGPFTEHGAVYLRPLDGGAPFVRCDNGLPEWFAGNIDTFQLAASRSVVAIGTDDGQLFVSGRRRARGTWSSTASTPSRSVRRGMTNGYRAATPGHLH